MEARFLLGDAKNGSHKTLPSISAMIVALTMVVVGCRSQQKARLSTSPLTAEQLQVYTDFLNEFSELHFKRLANQTSPFVPSDLPEGSACVQGVDFGDQSKTRTILHRFGAEITTGRELVLVDANEQALLLEQKDAQLKMQSDAKTQDAAEIGKRISDEYGFLVLSEVIFDKRQQFALLKYLYFCGSHCKHGGTLVIQRVGPSWTAKTRRPCTMIIN